MVRALATYAEDSGFKKAYGWDLSKILQRMGTWLAIMARTLADRGETCIPKPNFYIFVAHLYIDLCNYKSNVHLQGDLLNISV